MSKHRKKIKPVFISDNEIQDIELRKVTQSFKRPKRNFWKDTPFGRTLSLRNKTGKTIATVALGALATFTPINLTYLIQPTMEDLSLLQTIITILGFIISFAAGYFKLSPNLKGKLDVAVEYLSDELVKVTDAKSDQGSKITRSEIVGIVKGVIEKVFK